jgi:hypothetical protein
VLTSITIYRGDGLIQARKEFNLNPIYDREGQVVGWKKDQNIYHLDGSHAAVKDNINVYGHNGQHLGILLEGFFRDHRGDAVAFLSGAIGGPILPTPSIPPDPPIPSKPSIPTNPSIPPIPAIPSLDWGISWQEFINS